MGSRTRNSTQSPQSRGPNSDLNQAGTPARAAAIAARLADAWPDAVVELDHVNAYQLLAATILAAQSTDKLINTVTPALFARYPDPAALAGAQPAELEPMIFSTGFYRNKAKSLIGMAQRIVEKYGGEVPTTMAELVDLPGVARKTANVVLGSALGKNEGIVVDTHVSRLAPRLGLTTQTDPVKIEQDLMRLVPRDQWSIFAHRLIWHGRRVCHAKKPDCDHCTLAPLCPSAGLAARPIAATAPAKSSKRRLGAIAAAAKLAGAPSTSAAPSRSPVKLSDRKAAATAAKAPPRRTGPAAARPAPALPPGKAKLAKPARPSREGRA
jgi:endonuclease-3